MRKVILATPYLLLASLLVACSNKAVYSNIQHNQRLECEKLPPSQYEDCMAESGGSFEAYQQQRDELETHPTPTGSE